MDEKVFQRIRLNLLEKRQNLTDWISNTPVRKKQIQLGRLDELAVQTHLHSLDTAIVKTENHTLGICEVCHEYIEPSRLEMDYTCCVCLDHLSEEEKDRLELDLEFSAKVQQALLPQKLPEIPGVELAAFSRPAEYVGGDYFDFFRFRDGSYGLAIADVVGHGISASLLMASLQASLRTLVPDLSSPAEIVRRLNRLFYHNINLTNFVTLFLACFDAQAHTLTYCNAGHNPPLLFKSDSDKTGIFSRLYPTGAAVGLIELDQFVEKTINLVQGDVLFLYTDGVTEAINPQFEEFGQDRLAEVVQHSLNWSARELVQEVRQQLNEFTNVQPLVDDTTIVAYKIA